MGSDLIFNSLNDDPRPRLVEQRIRNAIVLGVFHDGEKLPSEQQLSRQFSVALVTVREALRNLRDEGLVRTQRGRGGGSFVTFAQSSRDSLSLRQLHTHTIADLHDIGIAFYTVSSTIVELATERALDDELQSLLDYLSTVHQDDTVDLRRTEGVFRLELASLAHSPRLIHLEMDLLSDYSPLLWLSLDNPTYRARLFELRSGLLNALFQRELTPAISIERQLSKELVAELVRLRKETMLHD